jgi:hypothetical protein
LDNKIKEVALKKTWNIYDENSQMELAGLFLARQFVDQKEKN